MAGTQLQGTSGMKAVALLLVWISYMQLDPGRPFNLPQTPYNVLVMLTAIAGVVAAVSIWTNARWMVVAYAAWLVLLVIGRVWHDARLEPVVWKVAIGGLIVAAFFGVVGYFLYRDQQGLARTVPSS